MGYRAQVDDGTAMTYAVKTRANEPASKRQGDNINFKAPFESLVLAAPLAALGVPSSVLMVELPFLAAEAARERLVSSACTRKGRG